MHAGEVDGGPGAARMEMLPRTRAKPMRMGRRNALWRGQSMSADEVRVGSQVSQHFLPGGGRCRTFTLLVHAGAHGYMCSSLIASMVVTRIRCTAMRQRGNLRLPLRHVYQLHCGSLMIYCRIVGSRSGARWQRWRRRENGRKDPVFGPIGTPVDSFQWWRRVAPTVA